MNGSAHMDRRKPIGTRSILLWVLLAVVSVVALFVFHKSAFPLQPEDWQINRREAIEIARERLRDVATQEAPIPEKPYVVANLQSAALLERRLFLSGGTTGEKGQQLENARLRKLLYRWVVHLYDEGANIGEYAYRAQIGIDGTVLELRRGIKFDHQNEARIVPVEARLRAGAALESAGFSLSDYLAPVERTVDFSGRTDLILRYRDREALLGEDLQYGVEVRFAGDELLGFNHWVVDPDQRSLGEELRTPTFLQTVWVFSVFILVPLLAILFVRRYHEGTVGVRRATLLFVLVWIALATVLFLSLRAGSEGSAFGNLSRQQMSLIWGAMQLLIYQPMVALLAFMSWAVGESWSEGALARQACVL